MHTIVLTRLDASIPWGFRLQGGSEDELPFVLTHVSVFFFFCFNNCEKEQEKTKKNSFIQSISMLLCFVEHN